MVKVQLCSILLLNLTIMKSPFLIIIFALMVTEAGLCQQIKYGYVAGNRESRMIVPLKSTASSPSDNDQQNKYIISSDKQSVIVYPNPVNEELFIEITEQSEKDPSFINLYDLNGRLLKGIKTTTVKTILSLSDQPRGLYILRITINGEITECKINRE